MPFSVDTKTDVNQVKLTHDSNAAYFVNLKPPSSGSGYSLTFPSTHGTSGQSLTSDGGGALSWTTITASGDLTDVQSLLNTSLTIGRDTNNKIDFSTENTIQLITAGANPPVTINSDSRILNVATPTGTNDATNKNYVDNLIQGITIRDACKFSTTSSDDLTTGYTYNNTNGTITKDAYGAVTIDSGTTSQGDRILVKNQSSATQNGIYTVTTVGSGGSYFTLTRATDFDDNPDNLEIKTGIYVFISNGTQNGSKSFVLSAIGGTTEPTITLGTTTFTFTQFSGHGSGLASNGGLVVNGSDQLSLSLNDLSSAAVSVAADSIAIIDADDNSSKKESIADLVTAMAGVGLGASSGVLSVNVDDSSIEINSDSLRVKASGITNDMLAGSIDLTSKVTGTLAVSNGGTGQTSYTDGELLIGNTTGNTLAKANLTQGDNVTITNGGGSITIASSTVTATADTADADNYLTFVGSDSTSPSQGIKMHSGLKYNPSDGEITTDKIGKDSNHVKIEFDSEQLKIIGGRSSGTTTQRTIAFFQRSSTLARGLWAPTIVAATSLAQSADGEPKHTVLVYDSFDGRVGQALFEDVCFLKGTKITMSDYSQKNIEDLSLEDNVLTYKINELDDIRKKTEIVKWNKETITGKFSESGIRNIWINPTDSYLVINDILKVTPGHIMFYKRENKYYLSHAANLRIGDELMNSKGEYNKITDILNIKEKINVYNFEVEHDSTYFAEDYLVHHMCELCSGYANII